MDEQNPQISQDPHLPQEPLTEQPVPVPVQPPTIQVPEQPVQNMAPQAPQPAFDNQVPPQAQAAVPAANQTDVLGIVSIVLFFVFGLAGLIVGIIGIRKAKKHGYSPTLSIIGTVLNGVAVGLFLLILPLLVITTIVGIQGKTRDTERLSDINALYSQIENYRERHSNYPLLSELNDSSWRQANMPELAASSLTDPKNETTSVLKSMPTVGAYSYQVYEIDDITPCTVAVKCVKYTLTASLDSTVNNSMTYTKTSLY